MTEEWETVPTKREYPLPDGATVVVPDVTDLAVVGDGVACRTATYLRDGLEIVWEIRKGVPDCVSVTLRADDKGLLTRDLHKIRLDDIRELVYGAIGIGTFTTDGDEYEMTPADSRKTVNRAVASRRRKIDTEFLKRVAKVHRAAPEGRRVLAVETAFGVHQRTAMRYINSAREAKFIHG